MRWRVRRISPPPPREVEDQKVTKQPYTMQTRSATEGDKGVDHQVAAPIWASRIEVDGAPLLEDASIRDFQRDTAGYVADAVE